jgi:CheY-like chemotaxis protein
MDLDRELTSHRTPRLERPPSVLVVDDEDDFLELTEMFLEGEGFRVFKARSASEAMWQALKHRPDVALVDLYIPGGDGFQILRAFRNEPETSDMPVFACTAADLEDARGVLRAGFDGHFPKPVNWEKLREIVRALTR